MAPRKESAARGMQVGYDVGDLLGLDRRTYEDKGGSTSRKGLEPGYRRTTVVINDQRWHILSTWATMQGETVKDVLDEAIRDYIENHIPDYARDAIDKAHKG